MGYAYSAKAADAVSDTTPPGWPDPWTFPTNPWTDEPFPPDWEDPTYPWPPGWPTDAPSGVTLSVNAAPAVWVGSGAVQVTVNILENGSDTDELDLHLIGVVAGIGSTQVNLKKSSSDSFGQVIWYQATNYTGTSYGFQATIYLDLDSSDIGSTITFSCGIVTVEEPITGSDTASVVAGFSASIACSSDVLASLVKLKFLSAAVVPCTSVVTATFSTTVPRGYTAGQSGTFFEQFTANTDTWADKQQIVSSHDEGAGYSVSTFGFTSGGATAGADFISRYSATGNSWSNRTPHIDLTHARRLYGAKAGTKGYFYYGRTALGAQSDICEEYDNDADSLATKTSGATPARSEGAATTIGSKVYAMGGQSATSILADNDEYDPSGDSWTSKTDMGTARERTCASDVGSNAFLLCGWTGSARLQTCDQYAVDTWTSKTNMPSPARRSPSCSTINGLVYIYAGNSSTGSIKDCDEYNPGGDSWASKADKARASIVESAFSITA